MREVHVCSHCKKVVVGTLSLCPYCGESLPVYATLSTMPANDQAICGRRFCPNCGVELKENDAYCSVCGREIRTAVSSQGPTAAYSCRNELPMNWHKFLVYCLLWAGAALNLIGGILCVTGMQYGSALGKELVYRIFPSLKALDIFYGISLILLAPFCAHTAYSMLKLKRGATKRLTMLYVLELAVALIYTIGCILILTKNSSAIDISSLLINAISTIIGGGIMIAVNHVYYKKRKNLFVYR